MQNAIIQRIKDQVTSLRTLSDEVKVQMALGKAEARDAMEIEKKNITEYLRKQKTQLDKDTQSSAGNRLGFLQTVENLEMALNAGVPQSPDAYMNYKTDILSKIYKLEEAVKNHMPSMSIDMQFKFETFKAKMDAFRLNLALHDKDNPTKVENIRQDFTKRLDDIRLMLAKDETDQTKLDQFSEDIKTSYKYLKQAIQDLS